jgi:hypothetical protein
MRKNTSRLLLCLGLLLSAVSACKTGPPHISSLKLSNADTKIETASFSPKDTIRADVQISNVTGKVRLKWQEVIDDVPGQEPGPIPGEDVVTREASAGGVSDYREYMPWITGRAKGKYRIEVLLLNEQGSN